MNLSILKNNQKVRGHGCHECVPLLITNLFEVYCCCTIHYYLVLIRRGTLVSGEIKLYELNKDKCIVKQVLDKNSYLHPVECKKVLSHVLEEKPKAVEKTMLPIYYTAGTTITNLSYNDVIFNYCTSK